MPTPRGKRYTIYDALEQAGWFDGNPANSYARNNVTGESLFKGAVEYPKMLYSPLGEEEILREGEPEINKITGKWEQRSIVRSLINRVVYSKVEEQEAIAEGWHEHPALAIRARVMNYIDETPDLDPKAKARLLKSIPQLASVDRIRQLEEEISRLYKLHGLESKARELDLSGIRAETAAATGASRQDGPAPRSGDSIERDPAAVHVYNSDRELAPVPEHLANKLRQELAEAANRPAPTI